MQFSEAHLNHASRYFPLVGLLLGTLAAALYWLLEPLLPLPLTLLLCTLFTILLTGGFHEDGLADVCDGFGGGWTPEQTLGIMKDSRLGSYGALGLLLALAFRLTALLYVPDVLIALLLGHTLSRFLAVSLIYSETYVQQDRLSKAKPWPVA
ncbi:adenosylcobinamide-GDP ribazoletransferase [Marinobacterium aestuariivivens]|uniref:Adenosylcobinamide-GDP ribazoletransferase n=1 Tax=Marinobacterium aestuariivivens TaxID=1698799 RepID=A0ABW2A4U5_9GAMM